MQCNTKGAQNIFQNLASLWSFIPKRYKSQFLAVVFLTVFVSFAEVVSIGAVFPFLTVMSDPNRFFSLLEGYSFIHALGIVQARDLLMPATVIFSLIAVLAGLMRLGLTRMTIELAHSIGSDLSLSIYQRTLYQKYEVHISRNSSEIISGVITKVGSVTNGILSPILTIFTSLSILTVVISALIIAEPKLSLFLFVGFGLTYIFVTKYTKAKKVLNSRLIANESDNVVKVLQEGLGGIRDIILDRSQPVHSKAYQSSDLRLHRALATNEFLAQSPRFIVEAAGIVVLAGIAYSLTIQSESLGLTIPLLGAIAFGAQRLLPLMQNIYVSVSSIQGNSASLVDLLGLLAQPLPDIGQLGDISPIQFEEKIFLNNISFSYHQDRKLILDNFNLVIPKRARLGIIGITGSGKSTVIDIIMGLLEPSSGYLEIDGQAINSENLQSWQAHVAHVPQAIFLIDGTIEQNIAFGIPQNQIDKSRVKKAAKDAQISSVIDGFQDGYQTVVGERGARLSGGQRQRIGIARALYKKADVIIFDEATSALDAETETAVMSAIECLSPDLTILIIAHRITTLKKCTQIIELDGSHESHFIQYSQIIQ
jgi:ATP-binding cassette subfamily B protein